jgi:glucose-1-phosphate adenylyltransferase
MDIAVLVDYKRSQLIKYLKQWQRENSKTTNIDILEPDNNGIYSGTANAVYQKVSYLQKLPAEKILIMPSDHAYKMDYRKLLAFHERSKADVTVGVVQVPIEEAHRFGTLTLENNGYVTEYLEKPDVPKSSMVSMGVYIFNKDILIERLIEDAGKTDSLHDFGYSIIPGMVGRDKIYAYKYDGFWRDIGTIEAYYDTSMELTRPKPPFNLIGTLSIPASENKKTVNKFNRGTILNSIISPGCVIKGRVENSVLSPGVIVEEQAVINNSIIMSNASIGFHSIVDSCIVDEDVNIGQFCYIGFGKDNNRKVENTLLGKGSYVPSHTAIACGCKILPYSNPTDTFTTALAGNYRSIDRVKEHSQNSNQNRIPA